MQKPFFQHCWMAWNTCHEVRCTETVFSVVVLVAQKSSVPFLISFSECDTNSARWIQFQRKFKLLNINFQYENTEVTHVCCGGLGIHSLTSLLWVSHSSWSHWRTSWVCFDVLFNVQSVSGLFPVYYRSSKGKHPVWTSMTLFEIHLPLLFFLSLTHTHTAGLSTVPIIQQHKRCQQSQD